MNTRLRRFGLALTVVLGFYVGVWAEFWPRAFFTCFPGFDLHWISLSGAYDAHLIHDLGSFYLALTAISVVAIVARTAGPGRLAGLGWATFGVLHFAYHLTHLTGSPVDRVGNVVSLGVSALIGIALVLPPRRGAARSGESLG